jgi:hypothetical protein
VRLLPREIPKDSIHETLIKGLVEGSISWEEAAHYFAMPGMGFHHSGFLLTLHTAEYRKFGRQTVCVPKEMQDALMRTSLAEIHPKEFRSPYGSLYMALPDSDCNLWGGNRTGWHQVGGVYARYVEGGRMTSFDAATGIVEHQGASSDNAVLQLYMWGMENDKSAGPGDDANFWFTINLREMAERGLDLEAYVMHVLNDPSRDASTDGLTDLGKAVNMAFTLREMPLTIMHKQIESVQDIVRIVLNAILYMNAPDALIEEDEMATTFRKEREATEKALARLKNQRKRKGRHLRRKLEEIPSDNVVWIGRDIRTSASPKSGSTRTAEGTRWVRGHWWPRKDTIARKVSVGRRVLVEMEAELELEREALKTASDVKLIADKVRGFNDVKIRVRNEREALATLVRELDGKRRWVRPYQRGKGEEAPPRTYILKGGADPSDNPE